MRNRSRFVCFRLLSALFFWLLLPNTSAQESVVVKGTTLNAENGKPIRGVLIYALGEASVRQRRSRKGGAFTFRSRTALPLTLVFSTPGFRQETIAVETAESTVEVRLQPVPLPGEETVFLPGHTAQPLLTAPLPAQTFSLDSNANTIPSTQLPSFLPGVTALSSGMGMTAPQVGDFARTANPRVSVMTDGAPLASPTFQAPLGDLLTPVGLDVSGAETLTASGVAQYGSNAFNGAVNYSTFSAEERQGLSVQAFGGGNRFDPVLDSLGPHPYYGGAFRYAKALSDEFAFKISGSYAEAEDWHADDYSDRNGTPTPTDYEAWSSDVRPATYDGTHVYGDERLYSPGGQPQTRMTRIGYAEGDLTDQVFQQYKLAFSATFNPKWLSVTYDYQFGGGTGKYDAHFDRLAIENAFLQRHRLFVAAKGFYLQGSAVSEELNDSYSLTAMARALNQSWKSDRQWLENYSQAYSDITLAESFVTETAAHAYSRPFASEGRLQPGTPGFRESEELARRRETSRNGAKFNATSVHYQSLAGYNWKSSDGTTHLTAEAEYNLYNLNSPLVFGDDSDDPITFAQYSAMLTGGTELFERVLLDGAFRMEFSEQIESPTANFSVSAGYRLASHHTIRAYAGLAYRMPSSLEQFARYDDGQTLLLGGLEERRTSANFTANGYLADSAESFAAQVSADLANGVNYEQSLSRNRIETAPPPDEIKPEERQFVGLGYKGIVARRLFIDFEADYSIYTDLIGLQEYRLTANRADVAPVAAMNDLLTNNYDLLRTYTNSAEAYHAYGGTLSLEFKSIYGYRMRGHFSFRQMEENDTPDPVAPSFNVPEHRAGCSIVNPEVSERVGFRLSWLWQDAYYWRTPFAEGEVPPFSTLDAQVDIRFPAHSLTLSLNATNLLNQRYYPYAGAPRIGGQYTVSILYQTDKL